MIISIMIKWFSKINKNVVFSLHFPPYVPKRGITLNQIHGNKIFTNPKTNKISGDGIFADKKGTYWIKTADCMCIAVVGKDSSGIVHAGWKGLSKGILREMERRVEGEKEVFVFPFAKKCCYEFGENLALKHFEQKYIKNIKGKKHLDMKQILQDQTENNVKFHTDCTICNKQLASKRAGREGFNWIKMEIF